MTCFGNSFPSLPFQKLSNIKSKQRNQDCCHKLPGSSRGSQAKGPQHCSPLPLTWTSQTFGRLSKCGRVFCRKSLAGVKSASKIATNSDPLADGSWSPYDSAPACKARVTNLPVPLYKCRAVENVKHLQVARARTALLSSPSHLLPSQRSQHVRQPTASNA